ncbi:hypothetical protein D9M69_608520 [compost metagenome]
MTSLQAELMLLAIGLQESRFEHRRQIGGPARGFWQFEKGGGVRGVLEHAKAGPFARDLCAARGVPATAETVYQALERDDVLAAGIARLFLFTNPNPLPAVGECAAAWDYYLATWRPGKPHRRTWDALYAQAMAELSLC